MADSPSEMGNHALRISRGWPANVFVKETSKEMLATQSRTLLQFSEAERPLGERLLKLAAETDRIEGYSEPHAIEIARLAEKLGQRLGLRGLDLSALKFAALAHDLGERTMKRDYLLRAGGLTWEEQLDLWRHPIIGEQAAVEMKLPRLAQLLIRWHHELWNGLGYPDGLAGTEIPLGARILRVVDTYCALRADRPHRGRQEPQYVEQFIADQAGLEADPLVVKEFLALLAEERPEPEPALPEYVMPEAVVTSGNAFEPAGSTFDESPQGRVEQAETIQSELLADTEVQFIPTTLPETPAETEDVTAGPPPVATDFSAMSEEPAVAEVAELADSPTAPLPEEIRPTAPIFEFAAATPAPDPVPQVEELSAASAALTVPVEIEIPDRLPEAELQIIALRDAAEHFWPVAQWIYEQWWATPEHTVQVVSDPLKEHLASTPLPSTLVAVMEGQPVGSISLLEQAVAGRTDLTPCLTALFVLPEHRHRGIGTQLLDAGFTQAKSLGAERVFFAVPEQEDFFARRGWQVFEPALGAQALVVLCKQ